jgi:alginate O-acetyltransferase complex protein AlgI
MSFVSPEFAVFFAIVACLFFLIPHRLRWLLLFIASYVFYMSWNIMFVLVLLLSTLCNYVAGIAVSRADTERRGNIYLTLGIVANLLILGVFKYFNFFSESLQSVLKLVNVQYSAAHLNVLLPAGISFYTFMGIAYLIDVHRRRTQPEQHAGIFALFLGFFPHVISGPIDRAPKLLPQFRQVICFDEARTVEGMRLILWGAFKKLVIADRLAIYVNQVYDHPQSYGGLTLGIATVFFAFQIYCDFSGYSDMAIGLARVLGFRLMDNFKQPYLSRSFTEFWQRWHISLSTWIRDYLYYPFARKAIQIGRGLSPRMIQLLVSVVVMALIGLWHGPSWSFVVWGTLHGAYLGVEAWLRPQQSKQADSRFSALAKTAITFALVCVAWVFFRANTLGDAVYILTHLTSFQGSPLADLVSPFGANARIQFVLALVLIGIAIAADILDQRVGINAVLSGSPSWVRWTVYYAVTVCVLLLGVWGAQEFIYFRF